MSQTAIKGIPVFKAVIGSDKSGMNKISLVDYPAVESDFLTFSAEQTETIKLAVQDEEKRLVFGVVMRANYPIYRKSEKMGDYFITFTPEVVRAMAEKYLAEGKCNAVNLQHEDGTDVEGVKMTQYFIKSAERGLLPSGFDEIEEGSLFAEFHVENEDVWNGIKDGSYKGFSLEGVFQLEPEEGVISTEKVDKTFMQKAVEYIESKLYKKEDMTIIERIKAALAEPATAPTSDEVKMGSVVTDNGTIHWDGDGELVVETPVYSIDADGNHDTIADGDYKTEDGKVITIADSKVSNIVEIQPEGEGEGEEASKMEAALKEKFAQIREAFSYAIDSIYASIYSVLDARIGEYYYIAELFNDYFVIETQTGFFRYGYTVAEDGSVTIADESVKVKKEWVEEGAEKPTDTPAEDEEKAQMRAEIEDLKAQLAKVPQGKSAHEAFKAAGASKPESSEIDEAMKAIRR